MSQNKHMNDDCCGRLYTMYTTLTSLIAYLAYSHSETLYLLFTTDTSVITGNSVVGIEVSAVEDRDANRSCNEYLVVVVVNDDGDDETE